ncbi:MAG: RidA family protein [Patescibacteria group bacterium]
MTQINKVETGQAPRAIGPYSQAIIAGEWIFCSGQIAIDPQTNELLAGGIKEQTERVLKNLGAILEAAGSSMLRVVKTDIYLKNLSDFKEMNEIYAGFFPGNEKPARATVKISGLPKNALIEISCIALIN